MYARVRHLAAVLTAAAVLTFGVSARAWVETTIRASLSTVEIEPSGWATVSHEIGLDVRGGPLRKLELATADGDAEVFPDASVTRTATGAALPLIVQRGEDGMLTAEIDHERGLRSGRYLFRIRYRTNLNVGDRLRRRGNAHEISWIGPRFVNGVGGVRAVFRVPPSEVAPSLPSSSPGEPDVAFGVLLGEVRRGPKGDEIELLRSHVAKGEPVLWRIQAGLDGFAGRSETPVAAVENAPESRPEPLAPPPVKRTWLATLIAALVVSSLVVLKSRAVASAALQLGARARRPFRLPIALRAPLAGGVYAAALLAGAELAEPLAAGCLLLVAMALTAERTTERVRRPRGPGRWLPLADGDAFAGRRRRLPGALFDAGTVPGFVTFAGSSLVVVAAAGLVLARSPYHALLILLGGAILLPLFFTGQGDPSLGDRVAFSQRFVRGLARRLRKQSGLRAVAWARVPDESGEPDELRLLVSPKNARSGLVALEAGVEPERGLGGTLPAPFVIVRVREGSEALEALPRGLEWSRGRRPEERVAILKPRLPTLALTEALVERLLAAVTIQPDKRRSGKSSRMSSGSSSATLNRARVASPAHAT